MKTVILCGGMGTRLKEETEFKPKPMINVGGKPILWHIMKIYAHHGFNEFVIALGYKGERIKEYFLNQKYFNDDFTLHTKTGTAEIHPDTGLGKGNDDFKITFVDTGLESLTGERLRRLRSYLEGDRFLCTYGDGVSNIDIKALLRFHEKKGVLGTVTGVHPRSKWGLVKVDENNLATEFRQKPVLNNEYVNGGFMIFENEFIDHLEEGEMIESGLERLVAKQQLGVYNHNDFWFAMDTYQDLEQLNYLWETDPRWKIWDQNQTLYAHERPQNHLSDGGHRFSREPSREKCA